MHISTMDTEVEAILHDLSEQFNFHFYVVHYPDKEFYQVKISGLILKDSYFDFTSNEVFRQLIDLNIDFEKSEIINSQLILPPLINQIELIDSKILSSKIIISTLDDQDLDLRIDISQISPILSLNRCSIDSLSTFDQIKPDFILQCIESRVDRIHVSPYLPQNLTILSLNACNIKYLGRIRTNSKLQLLSLEISNTKDNQFLIEFYSNDLRKLRIMGSVTNMVEGTLRFFVPTPELYFLDLIDFHLSINYDPTSNLPEFIKQLKYLNLPRQVDLDEKMRAFLKLLNTPLKKNQL